MAWDDSGNGKDPWKKKGQEPNDLDQIVQNWQRKIKSIVEAAEAQRVTPPAAPTFWQYYCWLHGD